MRDRRELHPAKDWPLRRQWVLAELASEVGEGARVSESHVRYLHTDATGEETYEVTSPAHATHVWVRVWR